MLKTTKMGKTIPAEQFTQSLPSAIMAVVEIKTDDVFANFINNNKNALVHFWAGWCQPCLQLDPVLEKLSATATDVGFAKVHAEAVPNITEKHKVISVPTIIVFASGKVVQTIEGAKIKDIQTALKKMSKSPELDIKSKLSSLINQAPIMLFMKGSPSAPRCGFSAKMTSILNDTGVKYSDPEVRQGLKVYSNWPTYPQLYVKGELIGGLDIIKELAEEGELLEALDVEEDIKSDINERIKAIINKAPIVLIMKGSPETPQCGFSKRAVALLQKHGVDFDHFNILSDQEVRKEIKVFSNWPTFPQLYKNGELLGGLDIMKSYEEDEELKDMLC